MSAKILRLSTAILTFGSVGLYFGLFQERSDGAANLASQTAELSRLKLRVAELETDLARQTTVADDKSQSELVDMLHHTGLDYKEYPEIFRALDTTSSLPAAEQARRRREILAAIPNLMPTDGWISSEYGERKAIFGRGKQFHKGIDIAGNIGTPIYAPADGIVRYAGRYGRFGNYISIVHGYGIVTKYGHTAKILVKNGAFVQRGQQIGLMGGTGRVTGSHLHYEVWVNDHVLDPLRFMPDDVPHHADLQLISQADASP